MLSNYINNICFPRFLPTICFPRFYLPFAFHFANATEAKLNFAIITMTMDAKEGKLQFACS